MYCKKCGNQISDDARFCNSCGASCESQIPVQSENVTSIQNADIAPVQNTNITPVQNAYVAPAQKDNKKLIIIAATV
ncbi:MAG: zinc ribbon domain-containing protein, partial [Lachnospiraceae bacterium]|nr:zinc ribbon domain-containing protein [Candidatus Merdinaster equi]